MKKFLTFIGALLFLCPHIIFSQIAPDLKTAKGFVLFTGAGEFTSLSPSTNVIGHVGNVTGVVTAFPPGTLTGAKHFGDGVAMQAEIDIADAYANLAGRTCGIVHGPGFGVGEILAPGVYCSGAASTLNGILTLDAANNPAAVFIIKIEGDFSAASGSQVLLINQASSCNVFWQINGAVALSNSAFQGTMLVNGAVSLNTGTTINGRALTKTGALIFNDVNVTICDLALMPLRLMNFDAVKTTADNVQISWTTTSEVNMSRYEVESSVNAIAFKKVGTVISKGNNFSTVYTFKDVDVNKSGVRYYRLKMIDIQGTFSYSSVKSIKFSEVTSGIFNVSPNPAANLINIAVHAENQENISLTVTSISGQKIRHRLVTINKGINNITEDIHNLAKGGYIISIKNLTTGKISRQNFQKI